MLHLIWPPTFHNQHLHFHDRKVTHFHPNWTQVQSFATLVINPICPRGGGCICAIVRKIISLCWKNSSSEIPKFSKGGPIRTGSLAPIKNDKILKLNAVLFKRFARSRQRRAFWWFSTMSSSPKNFNFQTSHHLIKIRSHILFRARICYRRGFISKSDIWDNSVRDQVELKESWIKSRRQ